METSILKHLQELANVNPHSNKYVTEVLTNVFGEEDIASLGAEDIEAQLKAYFIAEAMKKFTDLLNDSHKKYVSTWLIKVVGIHISLRFAKCHNTSEGEGISPNKWNILLESLELMSIDALDHDHINEKQHNYNIAELNHLQQEHCL